MNAKATFVPALIETTVVLVQEAKVVLEMTVQQAETMRAICSRIGGSPANSRRRDTDAIKEALDEAGVIEAGVSLDPYFSKCGGSIYFAPEA